MRKIMKTLVVMVVTGALVFSGIALAQSEEQTPAPGIDRVVERLQPLVDDGTITAEQAEAVAAFLVEELERPDRPRKVVVARHLLRHTADFLDIEGSELREAIAAGDTVAEVAVENGSSGEALVEYLVEDVEDHLETAVANGRIDEEQAAELLAGAEEKITEFVFDTPQPPAGEAPNA